MFLLTIDHLRFLKELKVLPGVIIGIHNLKYIRYTYDSVLRADAQNKLHELLQKRVKENGKKGQSINCKLQDI